MPHKDAGVPWESTECLFAAWTLLPVKKRRHTVKQIVITAASKAPAAACTTALPWDVASGTGYTSSHSAGTTNKELAGPLLLSKNHLLQAHTNPAMVSKKSVSLKAGESFQPSQNHKSNHVTLMSFLSKEKLGWNLFWQQKYVLR